MPPERPLNSDEGRPFKDAPVSPLMINPVTHRGSAMFADGREANVDDVWFQNNRADSRIRQRFRYSVTSAIDSQ